MIQEGIGGMTQEGGYGVLTDAQWAKLASLIEACRPHHKTECLNLRRTIEAIIWRHTNGAKMAQHPTASGARGCTHLVNSLIRIACQLVRVAIIKRFPEL